ncbi:MAG: hypothetical protein IID09_06740 [Candidatus Hydrogenedentes bacterium]|nr:hypothetical protein [Candidatus Hydrogenedentota bacterium]
MPRIEVFERAGMDSHGDGIRPVKSLRERVWEAVRRSARERPVSFYLLLAMVVMLVLGGQIVYVKDNPKQFAIFLSLYFLFFFVLIFRAVLDAFDIARRHFRKRESLFKETFAADGFAERLGNRVARSEKERS